MFFLRRWSPVLALCLAFAGWVGLSLPAFDSATPTGASRHAEGASIAAGPRGRIAAHLDGDHLLDYVTGRAAAGHCLIEVCLSSRPGKTVIRARGVGFAVHDVNADSIADLLVADGLSGLFTELENNGRGRFTSRIADKPTRWSGPAPQETASEAGPSSKASRPPKPAVILSRIPAFEPPSSAPGIRRRDRRPSVAKREALADILSRGPPSRS